MPTLSLAGREVVLIEGYQEDADRSGRAYPQLCAGLLAAGATAVHSIAPDFNRRPFSAWAQNIAAQVDAREVSHGARLIGHSFGAILAAAEAARRPYSGLVLCSLTPSGAYLSRDPAIAPLMADACGGPEIYDMLLGIDTTPWLEGVQIPAGNRHVLVESTSAFLSQLAPQADAAARILGTTAIQVPQSKHNIESYPTYVDAAVRAAS